MADSRIRYVFWIGSNIVEKTTVLNRALRFPNDYRDHLEVARTGRLEARHPDGQVFVLMSIDLDCSLRNRA